MQGNENAPFTGEAKGANGSHQNEQVNYPQKYSKRQGFFIDKEAIRHALTIEAVLHRYSIDILRGEQVRCPFHGEDRTPSASIKNGFFYCFICVKSLDIFAFIMEMEQCDFQTALRIAAEMAGLPTNNTRESKAALARTLRRRSHDSDEKKRVDLSGRGKYALLASVAREYRIQEPEWIEKLDFLLEAWLTSVPLWADLRALLAYIMTPSCALTKLGKHRREW